MNKLNVTLIALALVACLAVPSRAAEEDTEELVNEIEDGDADVNEGVDGAMSLREIFGKKAVEEDDEREYWSGDVNEQWGTNIINKKIPKTVDGRKPKCGKAKSDSNCRVCCEALGKAYSYRRDLSLATLKQMKVNRCVCSSITPSVIPN